MPELPPFPGESPYPVPAAATSSREDKNKKKEAAGRSRGRGGIGTLADLSRQSGPGSDSDYYTGRKKRRRHKKMGERQALGTQCTYIVNGMLVENPTEGGRTADAIFDQARQMGAIQGSFDELHPSSSLRIFTGQGDFFQSIKRSECPMNGSQKIGGPLCMLI